MPTYPSIEILEDRIAPATLLSPTTVTYQDIDGDSVVVKISKPLFTSTSIANSILKFSVGSVNNDGNATAQSLDLIDLRGVTAAQGMDISITVQPRIGIGDTKANVGFILAADVDTSNFIFYNNIDLGNVTIQGNLGAIVVGDDYSTAALKSLTVQNFGISGGTIYKSSVLGPISKLHVTGDMVGILQMYGFQYGSINTLLIDGALKGTNGVDYGGLISFTGTIGNATIGALVGSGGDQTGSIIGPSSVKTAVINSLHILSGGITGGDGDQSGAVIATKIGSLQVDGSITGGGGASSGFVQADKIGSATLLGSLSGGAGANSGNIQGNQSLGTVKISGSLTGGGGEQSGLLYSGVPTVSTGTGKSTQAGITIGGNLEGGSGKYSGVILGDGFKKITIKGSLTGGAGEHSGWISAGGSIGSASIGRSIEGGTGTTSGAIIASGSLDNLSVTGDLVGGDSSADQDTYQSGFIFGNHIGTVSIGGSLKAGSSAQGGDAVDSGAIRSGIDIGSITIGGDMIGDETNTAIISAVGFTNLTAKSKQNVAIGKVVIGGDMIRAEILAGYGDASAGGNHRGEEISADAQINSVTINGNLRASNIVAGVSAGTDGLFGTSDDEAIFNFFDDLPQIVSKISSVVVKGSVLGSESTNDEAFGIVAQHVVSVSYHGLAAALLSSARNDLAPGFDLGSPTATAATTDGKEFHVLEV